ncbi:hypothetical protein P5F43_15510 [Clostridium perfringens]|uniref:Viral A-type inclusion protein n=2 Tax=Clostridium perfringens TaxID=1502 RepID=A0AAW9I195_CLOPF|nr:hypothetical protein [Clostridium perfringens]MBI5982752.1 hypothetical protein [Clostridium perfringens]MBI5999345.1 hypothetical protein [Clostridium perfringens]MBI6108311.1 hypothetical protein [Clostridium perfringens]MDB2060242.1 hypothetical protein [Clostridium perfringens]MDB2062104.1 hypothetical protein [Clostridium perfringens]
MAKIKKNKNNKKVKKNKNNGEDLMEKKEGKTISSKENINEKFGADEIGTKQVVITENHDVDIFEQKNSIEEKEDFKIKSRKILQEENVEVNNYRELDVNEKIEEMESKIDDMRELVSNMTSNIEKIENIQSLMIEMAKNVNTIQLKEKLEVLDKNIVKKDDFNYFKNEIKIHCLKDLKKEVINKLDLATQLLYSNEENNKRSREFLERNERNVQKLDDNLSKIRKSTDVIGKLIINSDKTSKYNSEITEILEVIQGKMNNIDGISRIEEKLENLNFSGKNNNIKLASYEDEVIVNMAEYGEAIIQQLAGAARKFATNKSSIENINKERKENEIRLKSKIKDTEEKISKEVKKELLGDLASKFETLDKLFNSEDNKDLMIKQFLVNNGLEIDSKLKIGETIEISEENKRDLESKAIFEGIGTYKVEESLFKINEEVYQKAKLVKMDQESDLVGKHNTSVERSTIGINKILETEN